MAPHTIAGSHPRRDVPPRRDRPRPTWRSIPLRGFEEDALDAQWDVLHVGQHAPAFQAAISFGCGSSGHARQAPLSELRSAEAAVSAHLPITTGVDRVVLMAGRRYRRPLMLAVHSQYDPCGSGGSAPCMRPSTDGTGEPASERRWPGRRAASPSRPALCSGRPAATRGLSERAPRGSRGWRWTRTGSPGAACWPAAWSPSAPRLVPARSS